MPIYINIEIKGEVDTLMLWSLISDYKVNLTDLGHVTYIYGETALHCIGGLISRCALFGDLVVRIKGGGSDEQEKTT